MAFTRNWQESAPSGNTMTVDEIDDYNLNLRIDMSERLKTLIYGFIAGENDGYPGFKNAIFKQQAAAPDTPNADEIAFYAKDDGSACGWFAKQEDGRVKQVLKKSGSALVLNCDASDYGANSVGAAAMRLANDAYLRARNNAGDGDINILKVGTDDKLSVAPVTTLPDTSQLATSAAPTADAQIANKKYVDDKTAAITDPAYAGEQSHTFIGGLIIKMGYKSSPATTGTHTFSAAFPNACISVALTAYKATSPPNYSVGLSAVSASAFSWDLNTSVFDRLYYIAVGY